MTKGTVALARRHVASAAMRRCLWCVAAGRLPPLDPKTTHSLSPYCGVVVVPCVGAAWRRVCVWRRDCELSGVETNASRRSVRGACAAVCVAVCVSTAEVADQRHASPGQAAGHTRACGSRTSPIPQAWQWQRQRAGDTTHHHVNHGNFHRGGCSGGKRAAAAPA